MQQRAIATQNKIQKTAIRIFSKHGYHGTKIDQIATAAAVNKQRIYAYFHNKSGLFEQCLATVFEDVSLFDDQALAAARLEPSRLTEIILREYMELHKKHPYFWRMLAWTNLESDTALKKMPGLREQNRSQLKTLFGEAVKLNILPQTISFETYIFTLMAVSYFYHSNRKTLTQTFSAGLFTRQGAETLIAECSRLFTAVHRALNRSGGDGAQVPPSDKCILSEKSRKCRRKYAKENAFPAAAAG